MKKLKYLLLLFVMIQTTGRSQTVFQNYFDGEIYFKIKNEVPFGFDKTSSAIDVNKSLPYVKSVFEKYKVTKVESSFYFANSEDLLRTFRVYFTDSKLVNSFIEDLNRIPQIEYAERVPLNRTTFAPNDMGNNTTGGQYALHRILAQEAWDLIRNNNTVKIAIVDNAVNITHNDLANIVVASRDVSDQDNNPNPPNNTFGWDHGTHCSGIACAQTNNGNGIASIAFGSRLIAVKATPDTGMAGFTYKGYEGITWAAANGANIISCSWGSKNTYSITNQNVINAAYNQNIVIVASAGNNNDDTLAYPAAYSNVLSVANTDIDDERNWSSSFGTWVDVAAPGTDIQSCIFGNNYGPKTGTSMAAPLVAGLCALIKSINPAYTNTQIVNCVKNNADNIDALNPGFQGLLGTGRINAFRSVKCALTCIGNTNYGTAFMGNAHPVSSGTITSANNIINTGDVTFDAAVEVILQPNFIANTGCIFNARIDGCALPPRLEPAESQHEAAMGNDKDKVLLYPNPANDFITIKINDAVEKTSYKIYNSTMQLLKTADYESGLENIIPTADLSPGIYFIDVMSEKSYKAKFIISR